jgi:thiol-disulfide isomerase/thioredoxin
MTIMKRREMIQMLVPMCSGLAFPATAFSAGWKEGQDLPLLEGFGLEGKIPATKGRVVYLDFWASWCAPCKASFPVLQRWHEVHSDAGLTIIGVSVDEGREEMERFVRKAKTTFSVVRDVRQQLVASADVKTMPTAFLMDRKGKVRVVHNGFVPADEPGLERRIKQLLSDR